MKQVQEITARSLAALSHVQDQAAHAADVARMVELTEETLELVAPLTDEALELVAACL